MRLLRQIANLGYGSRRQVTELFRQGRVTDRDGRPLAGDADIDHGQVRLDGEALDPAPGMVVLLHKPAGVTCSHRDAGRLVYDLLPPRFRLRKPVLSSVGRLDRDTTGLLLLTDDGALLHRIIAPRQHVPKVYEARLAAPLRGDEAARFAAGTLLLEGERTPLAPARLEVLGPCTIRLTVTEGRYHQVRRMFAAVGNHVESLHRSALGGLSLDALAAGQWRLLDKPEVEAIFDAPLSPGATTP